VRVLAVGAHPDDVELGCGGTLARHARRGDDITILVMTEGGLGTIEGMSRRGEQLEAAGHLGARVRWAGYEDGAVPDGPAAVRVIDEAIAASGADVLYTHAVEDTHQDHRATATASLAAGRRLTTILQYETPSTRHFDPTLYVDVHETIEEKLAILRAHMSQVLRAGPVDLEAVEAQARFRGSQGRTRFAEAFVPVRVSFDAFLPSTPETLAPVVALEPALRSIG
jgi:LmbE family N-acetylglucosaminyl deacetylase